MSVKVSTVPMTPRISLAMMAPSPARTANGRSSGVGAPKPVGADGAGA